MKFVFATSLSIINNIKLSFSPYTTNSIFKTSGQIWIEINRDSLEKKAELLVLLNNKFVFHTPSMYGPYMLITHQIENLREIVDYLFINDLMDANDRSDIEKEIKTIEKDLFFANNTEEKITNSQKDTIIFLCEDYIDTLISTINIPNAAELIISYLASYPLPGKDDFKDWLTSENKFNNQTINELQESYEDLGKMYMGLRNIEETFLKQGNKIPSLKMQQELIQEQLILKNSERFQVNLVM